MIEKGQEIIGNEELSRNPVKELSALVKNIRLKKTSIDELNEVILNTIDEEEMDKRKGMNIMLLAGKGHENYQIVGSKRNKFDDRETLLSLTRS